MSTEPQRRSFVIQSDMPELARLAMLIELFGEMDKGETERALRYLRNRYVTHRKTQEPQT